MVYNIVSYTLMVKLINTVLNQVKMNMWLKHQRICFNFFEHMPSEEHIHSPIDGQEKKW